MPGIVSRSICFALAALGPWPAAQDPADRVQEALRNRIEAAGYPLAMSVRGERIYSTQALPTFYERRVYAAAWSDGHRPLPAAWELLQALRAADREGLRPTSYHLLPLEASLAGTTASRPGTWSATQLVDLDLLLTDAFLIYGSHLLAGRVDPMTVQSEWIAVRRERDLIAHLETALAKGSVRAALTDLLPDHPGYRQLRDALARYRALAAAGGWAMIADGPTLAPGDSGPRVVALRRRLVVTDGPLGGDGDSYDAELEAAVRRFQARHGLDADGVAGTATLTALNVPVDSRVQQIAVNLERWRWLPENLGDEYIIVNVADFSLEVVRAGRRELSMRVVVGRPYRRTPVFSDRITYLVFNPYWHVPANLAVQDILPQIKSDPGYLARQGMKVFRAREDSTFEEVDPGSIDWAAVTPANFSFRFRQDPGPANALGRVKFMFPNRFNVYLHDTPTRTLFEKAERDFSSGCIRIEKPLELADYLMRDDSNWTPEKIRAAIAAGAEETVRLPKPPIIHLLYWTAMADEDSTVRFRRDLYNRDAAVLAALSEPPPTP
jgi:murein L,D-transpeptidase YcbB/YkuD